jgi:GNAT superfamily N-acetyltransferase
MDLSDIPFVMRPVEIAGWNQLPGDWERLMHVAPGGCFLAEWDGCPAGTATAVCYGTQCAWIGMVLVDPAFRRRGIGGCLLAHCISYLKSLGVRTIKLDATDEGRAVYLKHGFKDEYATLRYLGELKPAAIRPSGIEIRPPVQDHDRLALEILDTAAFGAHRVNLLNVLIGQQPDLMLVAAADNLVVGYGLARPGRLHGYIGPVVAGRMCVAKRLVTDLAKLLKQRTILLDCTALNPAWCCWLEDSGLQVQRRLTRMYLGTNDSPGDPNRVYALSGFETG